MQKKSRNGRDGLSSGHLRARSIVVGKTSGVHILTDIIIDQQMLPITSRSCSNLEGSSFGKVSPIYLGDLLS